MKTNKNGARRPHTQLLFLVASVAFAAVLCSAAQAQAQAQAQAANGGPRFTLTRFVVEGDPLLSEAEIAALLQPFAGPDRNFSDVRRAAEALEQAYHQRGHDLAVVQLPEQTLDQGVLRLRVIEPRIGQVRVEGNSLFSTANIRASLPGLREGVAPDMRAISASLKVANTNPAKQTTLDLASAPDPERIDAVVRVREDRPWRIGLTADNSGSPETGRTRLGLLLQHANLWGRDHVGSMQYTTSLEEPSRVRVFGAGYHVPLYALGDSVDFFASHSNVDSGSITAGVLDLQVSGRGTVLGARYNHGLPRRGELTSTLTLGIDQRAYRNNVDLQGLQLGSDVTIRPLSLTWAGQLALPEAALTLQLTGVQNLAGGANGGDDAFGRQRTGAVANYRLLRYGAGYQQQLPGDWSMRLQFNGQYAGAALVPGEQFGAGGAASVRGFRDRAVAGDRGQFASAEVQTPNWCPVGGRLPVQCRALIFVDAARVSRIDALPGEVARESIASAGLGLRLTLDRHASVQIDYGRVVDGTATRPAGDSRVHVALSLTY